MSNRYTLRVCATLAGVLIGFGAVTTPAPAEENRRYQAVVLLDAGKSAQSGSLQPRVFVLDTRDGHMWTWEEKARLGGARGPRFGTVITYQGRVRPQRKMGEVVDQVGEP